MNDQTQTVIVMRNKKLRHNSAKFEQHYQPQSNIQSIAIRENVIVHSMLIISNRSALL